MEYVTPASSFFFTAAAPPALYTLSLHDALPICAPPPRARAPSPRGRRARQTGDGRSEEHTSELQSPYELVCRLLLEKKNWRNSEILYSSLYTGTTTDSSRIISQIAPRIFSDVEQ